MIALSVDEPPANDSIIPSSTKNTYQSSIMLGNPRVESRAMTSPHSSLIPRTSDKAANQANIAAIDALVETKKYRHIVAWGKWLGFAPKTVQKSVADAESENTPDDAIQKIDGK